MRFYKKCLWLCTGLMLLGGAVFASDKVSRPATKEDLAGVWEMVSVKPILDKTSPIFYPHQRIAFHKNASTKSITSEKPFTKEWLDKFQKQPAEINYSLSDKGLLTLTWNSRPHSEMVIAAYVLSDVPPNIVVKIPPGERGHLPKKGNITLSYLDAEGKVLYGKIFKKIG